MIGRDERGSQRDARGGVNLNLAWNWKIGEGEEDWDFSGYLEKNRKYGEVYNKGKETNTNNVIITFNDN